MKQMLILCFLLAGIRATAQEKCCTPAGVPDSSLPSLLDIGVALDN